MGVPKKQAEPLGRHNSNEQGLRTTPNPATERTGPGLNKDKRTAADPLEIRVDLVSERKRESNRKNALRSTGPRTELGKRRSRCNAIKHSFFVREMPLERWIFTEDFAKAESLLQQLVDHFQPVGPLEKTIVEMIVECCWKMRRLQIAETASIKVAMNREKETLRITRGEREGRYLLIEEVFGKAAERAEKLGYIDAPLVEDLLSESGYDTYYRDKFVVANQKAMELATQHPDGSNRGPDNAMKKAQSTLGRTLRDLKDNAWKWEAIHQECEDRETAPFFAQHLLPDSNVTDKLLRYQTSLERRFYRAVAELERLQSSRLGNSVSVPPTLSM